jgi:hypothetical protein
MAKPNYRQAKRHKELARKARQDEKLRRRSARVAPTSEETKEDTTAVGQVVPPPSRGSGA